MGDTLTRRSLLRASQALPAPTALATCVPSVRSAPAGPLPGLVDVFHRTSEAWLAVSADETVPEAQALWAGRQRLADLIEGTVDPTTAGIAAQIEYGRVEHGSGLTDGMPETHPDLPAAFLDTNLAALRAL